VQDIAVIGLGKVGSLVGTLLSELFTVPALIKNNLLKN
jgi:hypothetical protein